MSFNFNDLYFIFIIFTKNNIKFKSIISMDSDEGNTIINELSYPEEMTMNMKSIFKVILVLAVFGMSGCASCVQC